MMILLSKKKNFIGSPAPDLRGQERRVTAYPAEQRGAAGVLPGAAKHVQAGRGRHAPLVQDASLVVLGLWDVDPRWSAVNPVAHTTASKSAALPSAKATVSRPRSPRGAGSGCRGGGRAGVARARSPGPARPAAAQP